MKRWFYNGLFNFFGANYADIKKVEEIINTPVKDKIRKDFTKVGEDMKKAWSHFII